MRAREHSSRRRRGGRPAAASKVSQVGLIAILILSAAASAVTIYREHNTRKFEQRLDDQTTLLVSDKSTRPRIPPAPPAMATPRLLLADSLYVAREASRQPDGTLRRVLLDRADQDLAVVVSARSHWGEAWVTKAYVASLRIPAQPEAERLALIRSYADAPLLPKTGYWRTARSLAAWQDLPPSIRNSAATEAAWLLRYGEIANRRELLDLVRASPAYRPVFLRMRDLLEEDR